MIFNTFPSIIINNGPSELQREENQIIGKLYRDLLSFEYEPAIEKTFDAMVRIIDQARNDCQVIGSDGEFLEAFVKRLNIR
jgi:hypothetical protein